MGLMQDIEVEIERRSCRSLAEFVKRSWHIVEPSAVLKWGWALDAMCAHLEAVTRGDIRDLLINVPPGMMKSMLVGVFWPAWEWGPMQRPDLRYIGTSHKQDLATRDSLKCRRLIQSDWYQRRWPIKLTDDQNAKTKFENDKTGFRESTAFASITGSRGNRILLDDPLSVADANSPAALLAAEYTFLEALPSRRSDDKASIIVIMQRLHSRDTSGIILAKELDYVHLCLPMRFEANRRCSTPIGFTDPRRRDGELLLPERFSEEEVAKLEKTLGSYATAGQLQQRPVPRGGGLFKREWFSFVREVPIGTRFVRGWDFAATVSSEAAYTSGVKIGRTPAGRFVVADVLRERLSPRAVENALKNMATKDGYEAEISIPQDPGQAGKSQAQYMVSSLAGYRIRATPETGSKVTRAEPLAAQAEAGNVDILVGSWNETYLDELCDFPNGNFMDQVDASSRAFNVLTTGAKGASIVGTYGSRT